MLICSSVAIVLFHKYTLARFADMEWQTPAVSEKFQSRFGRRPGTSDSGDTGLGTSASDSAEGDDFCLFLVCLWSVSCNIVFIKSKIESQFAPNCCNAFLFIY